MALVGERVRQSRQRKGMSRRVLSERSGVSQRYLAQLEGGEGNISIALLFRVASALGDRIEWLVGSDDPFDTPMMQLQSALRTASPAQKAQIAAVLGIADTSDGKARRVCLIGLRGAGKSTLGRMAAKKLGLPFVELNSDIETQAGMAVDEVMALYGQEGYRRLERQALERIAETHDAAIVAAGGGVVSEPETFAFLLSRFHTVWVRAAPAEHMARVRAQGDERPMAGNPQAMDDLRSILTSREALYARADTQVNTSGQDVGQSLSALLAALPAIVPPKA